MWHRVLLMILSRWHHRWAHSQRTKSNTNTYCYVRVLALQWFDARPLFNWIFCQNFLAINSLKIAGSPRATLGFPHVFLQPSESSLWFLDTLSTKSVAMVDWISLAIPFAYLGVLIGSLATFSSLYRKRKAGMFAHSRVQQFLFLCELQLLT